jgi:hypothetical protein
MFRFFRRHQKVLMTAVAAMSAFSFCFYGLYSTFLGESRQTDPISGTLSDGTPVRQSRREAMKRLLVLEAEMDLGRDAQALPNVINAGLISKQILQSGLDQVVMERHRDQILKEWQQILEAQRAHRFYRHPVRSQIGWKQAVGYADPGLLALVETLPEQIDGSFLDHQLALLQASERCPSALIHQVLLGMERQARVAHDPSLDRVDLRLFGHKSLEDWLGSTFVDGCVDLILEGAHVAQRDGLKIRPHDVRTDWIQGLSTLKQQGLEVPQALRWLLAHLRLSEGQALDGWTQVILFQRWLDLAIQQEIHRNANLKNELVCALQRAHERARIQIVQSPIVLKSVADLGLFEAYLEGVGRARAQILELPSEMLTLEQVRRRAPELISQKVRVVLKKADREALMAQMPVRDILAWQTSDEGWSVLSNRMRELLNKETSSPEQRRACLLELDPTQQAQAARLAQESWLKQYPEFITTALDQADPETLIWELSAANLPAPLPGLPASSTMLTWLERSEPFDVATEGRLTYRVERMESVEDPRVLDYSSSLRSGALGAYLQRRLKEDWELLTSTGDVLVEKTTRPEEVADKLLQRRTQKVLSALQAYVAETLGKTLDRNEDLVPYRLAAQLTAKRAEEGMMHQFAAKQEELVVTRGQSPRHLAFELADGEWSLPHVEQGSVQRIQVLDRTSPAAELDLHDPAGLDVLRVTKQNLARRLLSEKA